MVKYIAVAALAVLAGAGFLTLQATGESTASARPAPIIVMDRE